MENKRYRQYKFKFYLNASHSIFINGVYGERHPHTWEIMIHILKIREGFVKFGSIETQIENFLHKYQDTYINDVYPFITLNPTLENICSYFKDEIRDLLSRSGWVLLLIEISETPARSYVISLFDEYNNRNDSQHDIGEKVYIDYKEQEKETAEEISDQIIEKILKQK